jgi:hypothetical protein
MDGKTQNSIATSYNVAIAECTDSSLGGSIACKIKHMKDKHRHIKKYQYRP